MSKSTYTVSGDTIHVTCSNLTGTAKGTIHASLEDEDFFQAHRCRIINGSPFTTALGPDGTERPVSVVHELTGQAPGTTIVFIDGNPCNLTRQNLKLRGKTVTNTYDVQGDYAYLKLPNGQVAYVDTDIIPTIRHYQWASSISHGSPIVTSFSYVDGIKKTLKLDRFIAGVKTGDTRIVIHQNGDYLDCRKANLQVIGRMKGGQHE